MKALLITHGTRGDVQPFLALAVELRRRGHRAVLAAPESFAGAAEEHGVEFAPLDEGPNRLLGDRVAHEAAEGGYGGLRGARNAIGMIRRIKPLMADVLHDVTAAARGGADVVVHSPTLAAQAVGEMLGVPSVLATLQPGWIPTSAFPCPMVPLPRLPRVLNRASYAAVTGVQRSYAGIVDTWRDTELGLPRRRGTDFLRDADGRERPVLQAFSPAVTPVAPDWPNTVHTTGFWYLAAAPDWTPPDELEGFLRDGPPPVYIGFGSMAGRDARRTGRIVGEAVRRAGVRAVIATGWGGIASQHSSDSVLEVDQVPHDWLFPRVAAIVHHGGGGTVGAALAAGRPQVVCPFVADQPHWAGRMAEVGVAPAPVRQRELTAPRLAHAITDAVGDDRIRRRANTLGHRIRAEHGVTTAARFLENLAA